MLLSTVMEVQLYPSYKDWEGVRMQDREWLIIYFHLSLHQFKIVLSQKRKLKEVGKTLEG